MIGKFTQVNIINTIIQNYTIVYNKKNSLAAGIRIPAGLISPMIRSLTSNIIPQEETGKIFAFCISIESFCSLFAGPLSTIIYTETIDVFPGAFDLIPVMIYIGLALFFV